MKFDTLIQGMADRGHDWEDLPTAERLELAAAHLRDVADEYASEAMSPDQVRELAALIVNLDECAVGRYVMSRFISYAKACSQHAVHDAMGTPCFLRRQAI